MFNQRHERKQIRLIGYDYSQNGYYFVTICTSDRRDFFGEVHHGIMGLNRIGCTAARFWREIPDHFSHVRLGEWVIMPNHMHGIVEIGCSVGDADLRPLPNPLPMADRSKMLLPKIIHGFKSSVTREIRKMDSCSPFLWQRSYHDRIIRDETALKKISEYIRNNPAQWTEDVENRIHGLPEQKTKNHYDRLFG